MPNNTFSSLAVPNNNILPPTRQTPQSTRYLQRQQAVDNTNLLSPPVVWSPQFFHGQGQRRSSTTPKSPKSMSPLQIPANHLTGRPPITSTSDSTRTSFCIPSIQDSRRSSQLSAEPGQLSRQGSSQIGSHIRYKRQSPAQHQQPKKKTKEKKDAKKEKKDTKKEEGGMDPIPVFGGVLIASVLGGPVVFIAGLKLGMFAAIGMGLWDTLRARCFQTTGKISLL